MTKKNTEVGEILV